MVLLIPIAFIIFIAFNKKGGDGSILSWIGFIIAAAMVLYVYMLPQP